MDVSYETAPYVIYIATHVETGRQYVGQTIQGLKKRQKQHFNATGRHETYFSRALKKYGADAFTWGIIWTATKEEMQSGILDDLEQLTINVNGTLKPRGFNIAVGGKTGRCVTGARRRPEDAHLPEDVYRMKNGFKAVDRITGRVRCFTDKRCSPEQQLAVVTAWLEEVSRTGRIPPRHKKRKLNEDDGLPSHIQHVERIIAGRSSSGYTVRHPGLPVKQFWKKNKTMQQKLDAAKAYLATAA